MLDGVLDVIGGPLKESVAKVARAIFEAVGDEVRIGATLVNLQLGAQRYVEQTRARCAKVKTIINKTTPVPLSTVYVPLKLRHGPADFDSSALVAELPALGQVVVTGRAGCGKSMLMRHLFLSILDEGDALPVYIELRNVPLSKELSLAEHVCKELGLYLGDFPEEALIIALQKGLLVLLFDGFDEVQVDRRPLLEEQLRELVHECPTARIVVSGRQDRRYGSWPSFTVMEVLPLTVEQVQQLVQKVDYDEEIKADFLEQTNAWFATREELISSPLLCSLMLMTFAEFRVMPAREHVFYRTAFQVLARKQDVTKAHLLPEYNTRLELEDFTRLFEMFCFVSYVRGHVSFEEHQLVALANEAIKRMPALENVGAEDFVRDLIEQVCVLVQDGTGYAFLHRSLQEYFVANYLALRTPPRFYDIMKMVVQSNLAQRVFAFALDLDRHVVLSGFVPKAVEDMLAVLDAEGDASSRVGAFFSGFDVYGDGRVEVFWTGSELLARSFFSVLKAVGDGGFLSNGASGELIAHLHAQGGISDPSGEYYVRVSRGDAAYRRIVQEMQVDQAIRAHLLAASELAHKESQRRNDDIDALLGDLPEPDGWAGPTGGLPFVSATAAAQPES